MAKTERTPTVTLGDKNGRKVNIYNGSVNSMKLGERRVFKYDMYVKEQDNEAAAK